MVGKYQTFRTTYSSKTKVVPVHAMKAHTESTVIILLILNFDTSWEIVVNFTPQPFYLLEGTAVPFK
jgi:hypothetical protein